MSRQTRRKKTPAPPLPPPEAPLAAELLSSPRRFGEKLLRASTTPWHYWAAPVVAGLFAGLAYALLLRPGLNLAAEAARAGGGASALPPILSLTSNAFGSFFLTILTFLAMWGLGRLGAPEGKDSQGARVPQIYSASFALLIPLYLLCISLVLLAPAASWALDPAAVTAAQGNLLKLQRAALHSAASTPAALALILSSLLGTLGQTVLAYGALQQTAATPRQARLGALLPLVPALLLQLLAMSALLAAR